ncbi:hypothetical protein [Alteriqipengyuania sp. 357]
MNAYRIAIALASALPLAACATAPDSAYPSLAIRDAERATGHYPAAGGDCAGMETGAETGADGVEGQFDPAEPAPAPPPPPELSSDLAERVAQLEAMAREAHADFERAVPATRAALRGRGSVGSKSWGRAEVAYANLRSIRARTAIPLADLDTLVATRSVADEPIDEIVSSRDAIGALLTQEDAVLSELAPR